MIIGFTNGCFDHLHDGHLHFLQACRLKCDYLIVAIDADERVRELKGTGRPMWTLEERIQSIQALASAYVDATIPFYDAPGLLSLVLAMKPNLMFKGSDYVGKNVMGSALMGMWGGQLVFIDRLPGISTTELQRAKSGVS